MNEFIGFEGTLTEVHREGKITKSSEDLKDRISMEKVMPISRVQAITTLKTKPASYVMSISGGAGEQNASYIFNIDEPTYYRIKKALLGSKFTNTEEKETASNNPLAGIEVNESP